MYGSLISWILCWLFARVLDFSSFFFSWFFDLVPSLISQFLGFWMSLFSCIWHTQNHWTNRRSNWGLRSFALLFLPLFWFALCFTMPSGRCFCTAGASYLFARCPGFPVSGLLGIMRFSTSWFLGSLFSLDHDCISWSFFLFWFIGFLKSWTAGFLNSLLVVFSIPWFL